MPQGADLGLSCWGGSLAVNAVKVVGAPTPGQNRLKSALFRAGHQAAIQT